MRTRVWGVWMNGPRRHQNERSGSEGDPPGAKAALPERDGTTDGPSSTTTSRSVALHRNGILSLESTDSIKAA